MMNETKAERRLKSVIGLMFLMIGAAALVMLFTGGCATSKTASVQSAPFSYQQGASEDGQQDFIHLTVHVLFRDVPEKGAITRFTTLLGNTINDLNIIGGVTSMGTQPERMLSRIEDGKRAHLSIPIKVPVSDNRETLVELSTGELKQAVNSTLEEAELDDMVERIFVNNIDVKIKSTPIRRSTDEPDEGS